MTFDKLLNGTFGELIDWFKALDVPTRIIMVTAIVVLTFVIGLGMAVMMSYAIGYIFDHRDAAIFLVVLYFVIRLATRPR